MYLLGTIKKGEETKGEWSLGTIGRYHLGRVNLKDQGTVAMLTIVIMKMKKFAMMV